MQDFDPLKIYYAVVLETDAPRDITPFQGFSTSWRDVHWALSLLPALPCDVLEPSHDPKQVLAQRMGGARSLSWAPLSLRVFEGVSVDDLGLFLVIFTGTAKSAAKIAEWQERQSRAVLHVSRVTVERALDAGAFTTESLHTYCAAAFEASPDAFSDEQKRAAATALTAWKVPDAIPSGLKKHGHNILLPNHMTLERANRSFEQGEPFVGKSEGEYTAKIIESAKAVEVVRDATGLLPMHFMTLLSPGLILAEPSLYRMHYAAIRPGKAPLDRLSVKLLKLLQKQRGLFTRMDPTLVAEIEKTPAALAVIHERQSELETFTLGVGLHAAQTCSPVVRLSPGVNHVFPALSAYSRSVRSEKYEARLKARRLFGVIQTELQAAIGAERCSYIEQHGGPLKIVSDSPIEWLPVGNLPLVLRYDCSRINATPGNLLMVELLHRPTMVVSPKSLQKILVVSSFPPNDRLTNVMTDALESNRERWGKAVEIIFTQVATVEEFSAALNAFDGSILIFDGHGADNADEPVGKLVIGRTTIDVWELHNKVRVPPIVILSACDTHGIDASSHATVGNGFLFLGARTVVATLLPVGGHASAAFVTRLVLRIADFLPAALAEKKRVLAWTEVVSGMQRMLLASEVLDVLVGPPARATSPRGKLQLTANIDINAREDERWYDNLLAAIANHRGEDVESVANKAKEILARSEAIRYIQLGSPESILIDDGEVTKRVLKLYDQANRGNIGQHASTLPAERD